jgi:hypothetical protein
LTPLTTLQRLRKHSNKKSKIFKYKYKYIYRDYEKEKKTYQKLEGAYTPEKQ